MRLLKVLVFSDEISLGCGDVCFLPFCLIFFICVSGRHWFGLQRLSGFTICVFRLMMTCQVFPSFL